LRFRNQGSDLCFTFTTLAKRQEEFIDVVRRPTGTCVASGDSGERPFIRLQARLKAAEQATVEAIRGGFSLRQELIVARIDASANRLLRLCRDRDRAGNPRLRHA
jgi:hypothetical protein